MEVGNSIEDVSAMNATNVTCDDIYILNLIKWKDPKVIVSLTALALINLLVIVGNCLVILAVFISIKLRTVTNLFIVSLAVADLMVGIAVLPFSATWEIFEVWMFGEIWCSIWKSLDVWMCTASILNLCAISLDRYVAVTRPVSYPSIMSSKKAKILIGAVWIISFVICFPPLVGWNDPKKPGRVESYNNTTQAPDVTFATATTATVVDERTVAETERANLLGECSLTCELTSTKGYVLYSALGSFYLPMFVMLFFYWRIYLAAVETTKAINQGFRTTKGTKLLGTRFEEQRLTLRIHRGRSVQNHHRSSGTHSHKPPLSPNPNGRLASSSKIPRSRSQERIQLQLTPPPRGKRSASFKPRSSGSSTHSGHFNARRSEGSSMASSCSPTSSSRQPDKLSLPMTMTDGRLLVQKNGSEPSSPSPSPTTLCGAKYETLSSSSAEDPKPKLISKMGRRNIKVQVKRFRVETKAAKTLGVICGVFLLCWFPFFTMYILRAFCPDCIPELLFSILFWLGYINSALNPCILYQFSKDFRFAFKKIICRCICQHEKKPVPQVVPIFLSSLGDDSEGNNENQAEFQ